MADTQLRLEGGRFHAIGSGGWLAFRFSFLLGDDLELAPNRLEPDLLQVVAEIAGATGHRLRRSLPESLTLVADEDRRSFLLNRRTANPPLIAAWAPTEQIAALLASPDLHTRSFTDEALRAAFALLTSRCGGGHLLSANAPGQGRRPSGSVEEAGAFAGVPCSGWFA